MLTNAHTDQASIEKETLSMFLENEEELRREEPELYWQLVGQLSEDDN